MKDLIFPQPPDPQRYTWRPARIEDSPVIHQLLLAVDAHDDRHWAGTLADLEQEFRDPEVNPATDTLVALTQDGQAAAVLFVYAPSQVVNKHRTFLWPDIHPDHRQRRIEDFLMRWGEVRARQILAERPQDDLPRILRGGAMAHDQHRIDLYHRHGFEPIRYFFEMRRDLSHPIDEVTLAPGLTMRRWHPDLDERTFAAFNDSFRDHWGFQNATKESWDLFIVGRESFQPDLSYVVMEGEEVIGFSVNFYSPEENERAGFNQAWIGDLGVRRPWRRQGVATALLNESMQAFGAAGIEYASLGVDSENPTGALGVYQRVGFAPVKRSIAMGKTLASEPAAVHQAAAHVYAEALA